MEKIYRLGEYLDPTHFHECGSNIAQPSRCLHFNLVLICRISRKSKIDKQYCSGLSAVATRCQSYQVS
jgi:hypothetical protein